jgi:antitoxin component YwqK of YwqJK toxin-antitoxin module
MVMNWEAGRPRDVVRIWHPNGHLQMLVAYVDGVEAGVARNWYEDGQLERMTVVEGERESGLHQSWWPGGQRKQVGQAVNGLREGPWFVWDEAGALVPDLSGIYAADRRVEALDEAAIERAAALAAAPAALPVEPEDAPEPTLDPLRRFDERGEPR